MSIVKTFSVGNGDMFYIDHNSSNFTTIDCCITSDRETEIIAEISTRSKDKEITRFISTHPDEDHIRGLEIFDKKIGIANFYCVKNEATKDEETESFNKYCEIRDSAKAFHVFKGCKRKWMNVKDESNGHSGIDILWPDTDNRLFKAELEEVKDGYSPNNISPIVQYTASDTVKFLWMGDLETWFLESICHEVTMPKTAVLFAPHHGRDSGKVPALMLHEMEPEIIVVGEAPSNHLHYYPGYNTITQNRAGDIAFACEGRKVHIFTSLKYEVDFLDDENMTFGDMHYVGTLNT